MAAVAFVQLASFSSQARVIKFYDVSTNSIHVGDSLVLYLEPSNLWDSNCIAVWMRSPHKMLGHLAREAACDLAPLLRSGLSASGLVELILVIYLSNISLVIIFTVL